MKLIKEYKTIEEREKILSENEDLILVEERNITDGNFLIFSDEPLEKEIIYVQVPKEEFTAMNEKLKTQEQTLVETNATLLDFMEASLLG